MQCSIDVRNSLASLVPRLKYQRQMIIAALHMLLLPHVVLNTLLFSQFMF